MWRFATKCNQPFDCFQQLSTHQNHQKSINSTKITPPKFQIPAKSHENLPWIPLAQLPSCRVEDWLRRFQALQAHQGPGPGTAAERGAVGDDVRSQGPGRPGRPGGPGKRGKNGRHLPSN